MLRAVCRLAALVVLAVVAARAVGGEQKTPLVELALLVPFAAMSAGVAAVLAVIAGARRTALLLTVLLAVQIVWLAPALGVGVTATPTVQEAGRQSGEIRVLTINTLTGLADAGEIMTAVRERRVDLLVTIEVTPTMQVQLERAGLSADLPNRIGRAAWGAGGTMLWSRWPIDAVDGAVGELGGTEYGQPRGVVRLPWGGSVTVTAVHTLSPIPGRVQRWRNDMIALRRGLAQVEGAQIAVGDFNATRDHRPFRRLLDDEVGLVDAAEVAGLAGGAWPGFTWPANKGWLPPVIRLDHVLVSPGSIGVRSVDTMRVSGTDHLAVFAVLTG